MYVLNADNQVVRRNIKANNIIDKWQFVESGLAPGEIVVIDGTHKIRPGITVQPVFADASTDKK